MNIEVSSPKGHKVRIKLREDVFVINILNHMQRDASAYIKKSFIERMNACISNIIPNAIIRTYNLDIESIDSTREIYLGINIGGDFGVSVARTLYINPYTSSEARSQIFESNSLRLGKSLIKIDANEITSLYSYIETIKSGNVGNNGRSNIDPFKVIMNRISNLRMVECVDFGMISERRPHTEPDIPRLENNIDVIAKGEGYKNAMKLAAKEDRMNSIEDEMSEFEGYLFKHKKPIKTTSPIKLLEIEIPKININHKKSKNGNNS